MGDILFRLLNVRKSFGGEFSLSVEALEFSRGEITALVGPNGAGKTTLLRILATFLEPDSGRIIFGGEELTSDISYNKLLSFRRRITFVSQKPFLFSKSVLSNILYGLRVRDLSRKLALQRAREVLQSVGIMHLADRNGKTLSAGEIQKVALARALALQTDVLLLDEPFANVASGDIEYLEEVLSRRAKAGVCIVLATHMLNNAYRLADRVIHLQDGALYGVPDNLFRGRVEQEGGKKFIYSNFAVPIQVITERTGEVVASINPRDILISAAPLLSSARNCLKGKIVSATSDGEVIRLVVNCGIRLVALITAQSYDELALNVGKDVYAIFKATSVEVL